MNKCLGCGRESITLYCDACVSVRPRTLQWDMRTDRHRARSRRIRGVNKCLFAYLIRSQPVISIDNS